MIKVFQVNNEPRTCASFFKPLIQVTLNRSLNKHANLDMFDYQTEIRHNKGGGVTAVGTLQLTSLRNFRRSWFAIDHHHH